MVAVDPVALRTTRAALKLSIVLSLATLGIQLALHWASPQFDPSWRMVSEYANGNSAWLLALKFLCWAASSLLLAYGLLRHATSLTLKLGIAFLIIAGVGEAMGGAFDINHPWHMLAAILGMNGLPIAALLIGWGLAAIRSSEVVAVRWRLTAPRRRPHGRCDGALLRGSLAGRHCDVEQFETARAFAGWRDRFQRLGQPTPRSRLLRLGDRDGVAPNRPAS